MTEMFQFAIDEDTIIATPTGISKSFIHPEKLVKLNMKGGVIEANEGFRPFKRN